MAEDLPPEPRATSGRFAKGRSGNPRGRPRKAPGVDAAILAAMNERVSVNQKGRNVRLSKKQLAAVQMANRGAAGDPRAVKMALDYAQKAEERLAAAAPAPDVLGPSDVEIAQRFVERIRRQAVRAFLEEDA